MLDCLTWANEGAVAERAKLLVLSNNGYILTQVSSGWMSRLCYLYLVESDGYHIEPRGYQGIWK